MYTLPFLLTTLHPSHMTLTEDRTFIPLVSIGFCVRWAWLCGCRGARYTGSWIVGWRTRARRGRVDCRSVRSIVVVVGGSGKEVIGGRMRVWPPAFVPLVPYFFSFGTA